MKNLTLTFLLMVAFCSNAICQNVVFEVKNNTGKNVQIYATNFNTDSSKTHGGGGSLAIDGSIRQFVPLVYIRIDYIVLDMETKDTLCRITALKSKLDSGIVRLDSGINNIQPPYTIQPRLKIRGWVYGNGLRVGDQLSIKLTSNKKVTGSILRYDENKITLLNKDNQEIEIGPKDIKAMKSCGFLISFAIRISLFRRCKYHKIKNVKFLLVEQKYNEKRRFWEWVEIE